MNPPIDLVSPREDTAIQRIDDLDCYTPWIGEGRDPAEDGMDCYQVEIRASRVYKGKLVTGSAFLGGCYDNPGEHCPQVHGYLPQMIEEALEDLRRKLKTGRI